MSCLSRVVSVLTLLSFFLIPGAGRAQSIESAMYQDLSWRHLGPFRGGRSVAAVGVTSEPLTYYQGGVGSGVWKTTDAGQSWENVGLKNSEHIGMIAVDPRDSDTV